MAERGSNKRSGWKRGILIALCVILSIILVGMIAVYILADSLLSGIGRIDDSTQPTETYTDILDPTDTTPTITEASSIVSGERVVNILLVGQDRRSGEGSRMHSDAMILCTLNKDTKTLTMTSFMRDLYVYIPDHYNERINVPYMVGGFPLLNDTLSYTFGVRADYNVELDFAGFMAAIDLVGGLDIELTAAEARYLNSRGNWDIEENQGWTLVEGVNHLTGSQALAYSRIRAIDNDFYRTGRQRIVLTALIEKAKTLSPTKLYELVKGVTPMLSTDMTNAEIMSLAVECIPLLPDLQIVSQRIPADGEFYETSKNGAYVICLNEKQLEANKLLLVDAMKEEDENLP